MGPEEKKPEDQRVEGHAATTPRGAPAEREGEAVTAAGDTLSGRTGAVEGEVPAGLGRVVEPEPAAEPAAEPKPAPVEPAPVRPAAAEPPRPAASPWRESEPAERERGGGRPCHRHHRPRRSAKAAAGAASSPAFSAAC